MIAHQEDICTIMTMESGKPLSESKSEFLSGCVLFRAALDPLTCAFGSTHLVC